MRMRPPKAQIGPISTSNFPCAGVAVPAVAPASGANEEDCCVEEDSGIDKENSGDGKEDSGDGEEEDIVGDCCVDVEDDEVVGNSDVEDCSVGDDTGEKWVFCSISR